jgi:hypothetical protein
MVRSIDQWCEISRGTQWHDFEVKVAALFGTRAAQPILAAVIHRLHQQAGHMVAFASRHTVETSCRQGAVHIWVPAFALAHLHVFGARQIDSGRHDMASRQRFV